MLSVPGKSERLVGTAFLLATKYLIIGSPNAGQNCSFHRPLAGDSPVDSRRIGEK
jgi:hypothetical protein